MARIRTIKPEFWDDLKISKVSRDARLLYIGMWNFADDLGVIIGDSLWIKSRVFPFDQIQIQQFDKWIQELVKSGFISLFSYQEEEFYYLPNLTRHQVINRPNLDKVNVQQSDLITIINSLNNHGTFTDASYSGEERKGEERKGEEGSDNARTRELPPKHPSVEDFEKRKKIFFDECVPFVEKYGKEMVRNFFDYWTEPNKSHSKMKFELEKTWDLARRFSTWDRNESKFNSNGTNQGNSKTSNQRPTTDEISAAVEIGFALAEANKNRK